MFPSEDSKTSSSRSHACCLKQETQDGAAKPNIHKFDIVCSRKNTVHGITMNLLKKQKLQENKNLLLEAKEDTYSYDIQMNKHTASV
jgi:hypothetical protein